MNLEIIKKHINEHKDVLNKINDDVYSKLELISKIFASSLDENKNIFWCGNGGSASDSQHLAAEFVGRFKLNRKPLNSISLNSDTAVITCIANDFGYESIFARQLEALAKKNDILVVFSTSGKSENIIQVLTKAKIMNVRTVAFLGNEGGEALKMVEFPILIKSPSTARIQEMHIMLGHILCDLVENEVGLK